MPRTLGIFPLFLAGCLSPASREDFRRLESAVEQVTAEQGRAPPAPAPHNPRELPAAPVGVARTDLAGQADLTDTIDLKSLIDEALRRNPELREAEARTRASMEVIHRAGALDDPVFKAEAEAVPLRRPAAFHRADDNLFGLSQSFPFPGKLGLRSEAALRDAEAQHEMYRAGRSGVIARLKKAYYDYFMLSKELEIHLEHVRLLEDFERITEAKFRNGAAPQQDALKAQLELVMLHNDVLFIEQRLGSVRAAINVLLNRTVDAPLGKPRELTPAEGRQDLDALEEKAMEARPELRALRQRLKSTQAGLELARRDAALPDLMVGVDYWQINEGDDAWGGSVSINLPWFTGKRAAEVRKMRHTARADEITIERGRQQVFFEVHDAFLRVEAARSSVTLIRGELLPKSNQAVEVSRSSYQNDKASFLDLLDAERSQLDVELSYYRALAEYESALADLEQAAGTNLEEHP